MVVKEIYISKGADGVSSSCTWLLSQASFCAWKSPPHSLLLSLHHLPIQGMSMWDGSHFWSKHKCAIAPQNPRKFSREAMLTHSHTSNKAKVVDEIHTCTPKGVWFSLFSARQLPNYSSICLIHNHRLPTEDNVLILVLKSCILNANIWKSSICLRFVCQLHNSASLEMRHITHQHYSFHIAILDRDSSSNRVLVYCEAL